MASYISVKQSWLRFAVSLVLAAGFAFLLCKYQAGPRLGLLYDMLLRQRPALAIANEILLIDTSSSPYTPGQPDNVMEPDTISSLLLTMTEFDASALILQAPVLGLTTGSAANEEEIRFHFDREFGILSRNISNLFDGIRTGSIAPAESAYYVNEMLGLSNRGKDRLISALVSVDEEGMRRLEQAAAVFGNVRRPGDVLVQVIRRGEGDRPQALADYGGYSRTRHDSDGVLRRIAPLGIAFDGQDIIQEHIVYSMLKPRFRTQQIVQAQTGPVLALEERNTGTVKNIPLDLNNAVLFEVPHHSGEDFRRINIRDFLDYDEIDKSLRRLLEDFFVQAENMEVEFPIPGEENPLYLYDYALALKEDLLLDPSDMNKALWKNARHNYFLALENLFYYIALNTAHDEDVPESDEPETEADALLPQVSFPDSEAISLAYNELAALRQNLQSTLFASFCILGNSPAIPGSYTDTEASALLANSILTGRAIKPGAEIILLIIAFASAFFTCLLLLFKKIFSGLVSGLVFIFLIVAGFSVFFIFSGIWYDPLIPAATAGMVTFISFVWAFLLKRRYKRLFRTCYGANISVSGLKHLIQEGKPKPGEIITMRAAVAAIQDTSLLLQEHRDSPESAARSLLDFRKKCGDVFKKAGGMVAGNGGDLVLACFGSPLERIILGDDEDLAPSIHSRGAPAVKTAGFISDIFDNEETKLWSFGLDIGLCAFTWSPLSGYSVFGPPVIRARILSNLTQRYHSRILVTSSFFDDIPNHPVRKIAVLKERDGSEGQAFYELLM